MAAGEVARQNKASAPKTANSRGRVSLRPTEMAAKAVRSAWLRRQGDRQVPAGQKARRTRSALMRSARVLFEKQGYLETTVAQIAANAGVSQGTFYQYFRDRGDIIATLVYEMSTNSLEGDRSGWNVLLGRRDVYRIIYNFVATYADNAGLMGVWEEVCHVDTAMADLRRDVTRLRVDAIERELLKGSRCGACRRFTPKSARLTAPALAAMVDRYCYVTYVFDPPTDPAPPEELSAILADLWASSIEMGDVPNAE